MPLAGPRDPEIAVGDGPPSVITITAEPGIDAIAIGRLVAERCGMRLVGVDAAVTVATHTGLPVDVVAELLARAAPAEDDLTVVSAPGSSENMASLSKNQVISERRRMITRLAASGDVVIVCDGAAEVLTGEPRALHVLLRRSEEHGSAQVVQGRFDLVVLVPLDPERIEATARRVVAFIRAPTRADHRRG